MTRHLRAVNGAQAELAELEGVIERTLRESFVELGRALARIRDERLYKTAGFSTFEAYCRERWDFGLNYAYKQMAASDAVCTIVQKGLPAPANEAQVRELLKLPEGREEAWAEAVDTAPAGKVTAAHVASVVAAKLPPKPSKPPAATPVVAVSSPIDAGVRDGYDIAEAEILGHDDTGDSARAPTKPASALTALLDRYEREAREHRAKSVDAAERAKTAPMRSPGSKRQTARELRQVSYHEQSEARWYRRFARDLRAAMGLPPHPEMAEPRDDDDESGVIDSDGEEPQGEKRAVALLVGEPAEPCQLSVTVPPTESAIKAVLTFGRCCESTDPERCSSLGDMFEAFADALWTTGSAYRHLADYYLAKAQLTPTCTDEWRTRHERMARRAWTKLERLVAENDGAQ